MAIENITIDTKTQYSQTTLTELSGFTADLYGYDAHYFNGGTNFYELGTGEFTIVDNNGFKVIVIRDSANNGEMRIYYDNALVSSVTISWGVEVDIRVAFGVDHDTELGYVVKCFKYYNNYEGTYTGFSIKGTHELYTRLMSILPIQTHTSNGGGATHIAKVTGQLKDLSSNLSNILIVSGGGGGGLLADDEYPGKNAGGISGSGDNSADQSTGNAFGQGESGTNASGGGSGLYGGYKGTSSKSGGAGSGYIGNSLVSNKKMVGYNIPTSSAESTKTESVNEANENPVSGKPKIGNGFARIKLLRATSDISFFTSSLSSDLMVEDWDVANVKDSLTYGNPTMQPTMYSEFFLTEWNFNIGNEWAPSTTISNGELVRTGRGDNRSDSVFWIPVNRINKTIIKITADYKVTDQRHWGSGFDRIGFWVGYVDANNEWHSVSLGNKYPDDENWHTGGEWVYNGTLIPYIDYIGIEGGDGIYHAKNIVLTVG